LLDKATLSELRNDELLAIHQDPLGRQASPRRSEEGVEIWSRPLADGSWAVAAFNRRATAAAVGIEWANMGLAPRTVRDVSNRRSLDVEDGWAAEVPEHGSVVLRVW
jgi:alpha-galactosidase